MLKGCTHNTLHLYMELQPLLIPSRQRSRSHHMDATRDDMADVRGEISSVIEQIDSLREDLYNSDRS